MRVLLFHSWIPSVNHFVDHANAFLKKVGCETFICAWELTKEEEAALENFLRGGVHVAIMYNGIGMQFKKLYDSFGIPVVNILLDHPMSISGFMFDPPNKYIQFSPDEDHVVFCKKYWNVENSFFLPHMGTASVFSGGERPIGLLFSGSYTPPEEILLNEVCQVTTECYLRDICFKMIDYMLMDSAMTLEEACEVVLRDKGFDPAPRDFALILTYTKPVDLYIRMHYRDKVVRTIVDYGIDITVIGGGWDKSGLSSYSNFHWIPWMPFDETLQYMRQSKLVLNVMPWFKAGTHDRIFNTLLSGACPVSDKSKWLEENFNDKEDIAFYDLDELEALPGLIEELLQNDDMREKIIRNGQEKVLRHYTTASVIGEALQKVIDIYYS